MASTDPPAPPCKKRKLQDPTDKALTIKRRDELLLVGRSLPVSRFKPYLQGTVRPLGLQDPHFRIAQEDIEALIGYNFKKPKLLLEAIYPLKNEWARIGTGPVLQEGNYRLAMMGDVVLKMAILDSRFDLPELNGTLRRSQSMLVR